MYCNGFWESDNLFFLMSFGYRKIIVYEFIVDEFIMLWNYVREDK